MLDMRQAVRELAARIGEEVDYHREAANVAAFGRLYRDHPFIRIPDVVAGASGDRVLTLTYMEGMDWVQAHQHIDQDLKNAWAEAVFRFLLGSYRHANLMYGDPRRMLLNCFALGPWATGMNVSMSLSSALAPKRKR